MKFHSSNSLARGDIIFYLGENPLSKIQSLIVNSNGADNIVHCGICIHGGINPTIRHTFKGKVEDYILHPNSKSNFLIYRNKDFKIRNEIADVASQVDIEKINYSYLSGITGFLTTSQLDPNREILSNNKTKEIDNSQFCSKFVTQIVKKALSNMATKESNLIVSSKGSYPSVRSASSPKTVEAEFYRMAGKGYYEIHNHCEIDPFEKIIKTIGVEADRIGKDSANGSRAYAKSDAMKNVLAKYQNNAVKIPGDLIEKTQALLKEIIPILKNNTGWGIRAPTSYLNVMKSAAEIGIFKRDLILTQEKNKS